MSGPRGQYLLATFIALLAAERFVDLVEQHPAFADLLTQRPLASAVYWETAT